MRRLHSQSNPFVRGLAALLAFTTPLTLVPAGSFASPQGEQVVSGSAEFSRQGDLTQITASDGAIIRYTGFDIAEQETVQFIQPDASARVLNHIGNHSPTQIDGNLLANGIVYLVNPAGVYFGGKAVVDVAGLFAAAGAMNNQDFLARRDRFTRNSA